MCTFCTGTTFLLSCPYFELPLIPVVNAIIENSFLSNNPSCAFHVINSLSSFPVLLWLQGCLPNYSLLQGKKRQERAWTGQEENLDRSCSQGQQLTRHKMGMGGGNSLPGTSICPILPAPSGTLWAGGGHSLISNLMLCFAFAAELNWITAKMADDAGQLHPHPISTEPESRIPVFWSYLQNKAAHNALSSLSAPELEWHCTFTLCKSLQVFSLKSCKEWNKLGYQKSFRQNLLIVLISFLNVFLCFCIQCLGLILLLKQHYFIQLN